MELLGRLTSVPGARRAVRTARRAFDSFFCSSSTHVTPFGKDCVWYVATSAMRSSPVVISAGVGNDISFEKELAAYYDTPILLLDPSPTALATMARPENGDRRIEFLPVGLAAADETRSFAPPMNPEEGSFWLGQAAADRSVTFPCRSLSSLVGERGWDRVDLLKIDVEGFEYEVVDEMLRSGIRVNQLCIEFHQFMDGIPLTRTLGSLRDLYRAGFRVVYKSINDYTMVRVG